MTETLKPKVLVVGGGPGGYVAAIRAGQLGLDTVLVESGRLGGTCLTRGCIPSKALIHAAGLYEEAVQAAGEAGRFGIHLTQAPELRFDETVGWKDGIVDRLSGGVGGLLRKARVRTVTGWATFSDAKTCTIDTAEGLVTIQAEHVILATGSTAVELPFLPFGGRVISSAEALSLAEVPATLAVVGGGYIGLELGIAFAKLGSRVTIVEAQDRILPLYDAALTAPVSRWLEMHGVTVHLGARALGQDEEGLLIETAGGQSRLTIPAERILVTVGRKPLTEGWGLDQTAAAMEGRFVRIDDRCATSTTNVWAIGDLVGEPMLAHKASAQGEMVAEIIAGQRRRFDPVAIAAVCFTEPEIVSVGLTPDQAPEGIETVVGQFPFQANGRALSMQAGDDGGFVRVLARKGDHRILGIQAVGRHVSELAGEFATLMEMGAVLEDVAGTIHVHPTLGEAIHESALKALGHAIHI
ncbi:MAG: dihydrolipoyl dehydrogenase [Brevundimonas subvibrioides]|uniref:Dihydrolipoyl dehydrogenase n=1 Tax=Brevundimonas subvibrioides TaxID=74313 RepID=A0A258HD07_9CAUL|nr:dihydrolipoyl dehydrogenase [Brevundimonas subvibrioides]OYX54514.1 MAG: dihydrolipoyl dehydrogenase [Brevundimonas subvibrioides]